MILKLMKALLQRGQKKAKRRVRRFFRKLLGTALLLALAAAGTYLSYSNRHEILSALKTKVGAKLGKA